MQIDPPLTNPVNPWLMDEASLKWVRRGLPVVAPGKEHRMILGAWGNFSKDVVRQYGVAVTYRDDTTRKYTDTFVLDIDALPARPSDAKTVHSVAEELEKLNQAASRLINIAGSRDTSKVSPT